MRNRLDMQVVLVLLVIHLLIFSTSVCVETEGATVDIDDSPFNFIAYGDTRNDTEPYAVSSIHDDMIDLYLAHSPELIIHTGDLALLGGNWTQLMEFNESMAAVWESGIPFYSAPGNHELYIGGWASDYSLTNYTKYVHYEDVAAACGGTELYYSFDYGGTHFIALNTEDIWMGDVFIYAPAQMTWLRNDLANVDHNTFVVVAFHRPAYSVREARPDRWAQADSVRDEFHSLFLEYGVDLVLNGHDHYYYRVERDGIYYVVTGGGGAPPAGIDRTAPTWQEGDVGFTESHYCDVQVNSSHIVVDAKLMDGTTADSFSISKSDTTSTTTTSATSKTTTITSTTTTTSTESTKPPPPDVAIYVMVGMAAVVLAVLVVVFIRRSVS